MKLKKKKPTKHYVYGPRILDYGYLPFSYGSDQHYHSTEEDETKLNVPNCEKDASSISTSR
jgi:hypothetical protein